MTTMEQRTTAVAYAASAASISLGALSATELAAIGGLIVAVATFLVNWYYRHQRMDLDESTANLDERSHKLDERSHDLDEMRRDLDELKAKWNEQHRTLDK